MKLKRSSFLLICVGLVSCSLNACNSNETTTATIYERKHIDGNRLMIKYRYKAEAKDYTDSTTIENTVIKSDTIEVSFDKNIPEKSTPHIDKR